MEFDEGWDIVISTYGCEMADIQTEVDSLAEVIERNSDARGTQVQDIAEYKTITGNDITYVNSEDREGYTTSCRVPITVQLISYTDFDNGYVAYFRESTPSESNSYSSSDPKEIKDKPEDTDTDQSASPSIICRKLSYDWTALCSESDLNIPDWKWNLLYLLSGYPFFYLTNNPANITALHPKADVSQMEKIIDELRKDIKLLKEEMLSRDSEMNHMLYGVVQFLERQEESKELAEIYNAAGDFWDTYSNGIEKDKWFFQRGDLGAKLREGHDELLINWFLKNKLRSN